MCLYTIITFITINLWVFSMYNFALSYKTIAILVYPYNLVIFYTCILSTKTMDSLLSSLFILMDIWVQVRDNTSYLSDRVNQPVKYQ